jgi:diguanylate cyclase (GGDEF)-like protein/PAS domain S-box-containing protein
MRISTTLRLAFGLACLTLSVLLAAQALGLVPDRDKAVLEGRADLAESVAVQACLAVQHDDMATVRSVLLALVARNPQVESAGLRRADGKLLVDVGDHKLRWKAALEQTDETSHVQVPILRGSRKLKWGSVEICFAPLVERSWRSWFGHPLLPLAIFVVGVCLLAYSSYLKKMLRYLDPSSVIPDRVRETLDALAEGVVVLDRKQRIVLANKAFAKNTGRTAEELQGSRVPDIHWSQPGAEPSGVYPWERTLDEGVAQTGVMVALEDGQEGPRTFMVNSTPILGGDGRRRGALATFDDVTSIEQQNRQLEQMLTNLQESRDEIHRQNEELQLLATRDPLTGCFNRRAFFNQFETIWKTHAKNRVLSVLMVDIDHFKSINDTHGHSVGDQVLQHVAAIIRGAVREEDRVCRYGGEEFCVLLPDAPLEIAQQTAERLRAAIAEQPATTVSVTASLGITSLDSGAHDPHSLIEQADKALYASKHNGRNRVTCFRDLPADYEIERPKTSRAPAPTAGENDIPIPFHAVTALTSALAYRDALTAEHSRRVADLCVVASRGIMSERECYVLEVAALLHDIGKLGVPDAILLKPGPLTEEEWKVMGTHDRIGVEIISAAFSSPELTAIVKTHHAWFNGNPRDASLPKRFDIPVGARILTIADAFDAMVSDRVYRKGRPQEEAFAELRRCAGKQFDPELVEHFIESVGADDRCRHAPQLAVSKQAALRIGMQIERLAGALDSQDYSNLSAMAGRLAATATKEGVPEIAELATELESLAADDPDLLKVVELTTDLLELCRATQNSYLTLALDDESAES